MAETDTISDEERFLEELFKDRYTEEADEKYRDEVSRDPSNPPAVYPWTAKFNQSFGRHMMFRGRGQGHSRYHDRNRDRSRGGYQNLWRDGAPSWSQQGSSRPYYRDREHHSYPRY